ncbi:MAG: S49 family peptidase, partial [Bdellovibrio sp.]
VAEGRKMPAEKLARYADGRVFTGAQGVQLGFADSLGGVRQAFDKAGELANLGKDFEVFSIPKFRPGLLEILSGGEEDEEDWSTEVSLAQILGIRKSSSPESWIQKNLLKTDLVNRPLYLMPGSW